MDISKESIEEIDNEIELGSAKKVEAALFISGRFMSLQELKDSGVNPFPYTFHQTNHALDINQKYVYLKAEEKTNDVVLVAGRIMLKRVMGKASFMHLQDQTGKVQLFFSQEILGEQLYDLIIKKIGALKEDSETLIQRAASKYRVLIVSPTSFLAYLQTVLQGLNALHIEEKAVEIIKRVEELGRHLKSYEEYYAKLGNSLSTTINHYNSGYKELGKVDKDVLRITGSNIGIDTKVLEKPLPSGSE